MFKELKNMLKKSNEERLCDLCDRDSVWSRYTIGIKRLLKDSNLDVNCHDDVGMSALHYAISNKYYKAVDLLLKHSADPSLLDRRGFSPLGYAFRIRKKYGIESSRKMIIKLIKAGAKANILTLKKIVKDHGFSEKIITALLTKERTQSGFNKGNMVDDQILKEVSNAKEALDKKNISKKVIDLLLESHPSFDKISQEHSLNRVKCNADNDQGIDLSFIEVEAAGKIDNSAQESVRKNLDKLKKM